MDSSEVKKPIDFSKELLADFFDLDAWDVECLLFLSRTTLDKGSLLNRVIWRWAKRWEKSGYDFWVKRFKDWERHLNIYEQLRNSPIPLRRKQDVNGQSEPSKTKVDEDDAADGSNTWRIDKLNGLLNILDTKIGMALSFNSLLLAGVSFLLARISGLADPSKCTALLQVLAFLVLVLLLASLWVLLRGFRRVVWGDLGHNTTGNPTEMNEEQAKNMLVKEESDYAGYLIIAVSRRTNTFRISTYLTKAALVTLAALILMGAIFSAFKSRWCVEAARGGSSSAAIASPTGTVSIQINGGAVQFGGVQSVGSPSANNRPTGTSTVGTEPPTTGTPTPPSPTNTPTPPSDRTPPTNKSLDRYCPCEK
jgi:hypothetical protein